MTAHAPLEAALKATVEIDGDVWTVRQFMSCFSDNEARQIVGAAIAEYLRARKAAEQHDDELAMVCGELLAEVERGEK